MDAGCAVCHQLAHAIEEAAAGKLEAVSIRDPQAREWLEQAYPAGWTHRPYLVTVGGERVQAYAGLGMALRLGSLLGPRKAWRVWNLARQHGVGWPAGDEFSAERRGFLKRAALFVGSVFFFPRFGTAGGQDQAQGRPRHPFEGIRIKSSRELEGEEKAQAVRQALNSRDVRNVLEETAAAPGTAEAMAVSHELEGGNTLLAVGFPTNQGAVAYYQLAQPIDHYATWAWLYVVEDEETALVVSASVNGGSIALSGRAGPVGAGLEEHCGSCYPDYEMDCNVCTGWNWFCIGGCCLRCVPPTWPCVVLWCPSCLIWCCNSWTHSCCTCPPPP